MTKVVKFEEFLSNQVKGVLTEDTLTWQENGKKYHLALADVVGISIPPESAKNSGTGWVINAYHRVTKKSWFGGIFQKSQRILQEYQFTCPNFEIREQWIRAIYHTLNGIPIESHPTPAPRRLLILLNRQSGKKNAREIFQKVKPLLDKSFVQFTVAETMDDCHAQEMITKIELASFDHLVLVGGDGTVFAAINGLMRRTDWEAAIKIPIGVIPGGTGNGLCKTLLEQAGEPYDLISAAFLIVKGKSQPIDLVKVEQNGRCYYSILSLSWGFISDVDIESDRLRFLGSIKNDIYALLRILNLRTYKGRLSFLLASEATLNNLSPQDTASRINPISQTSQISQVIEDEFILIWAMNIPWAAYNIQAAPNAQLSDGTMDILVVRRGISKWQLLTAFLQVSSGKHILLPYIDVYQVNRLFLEPLTNRGILAVDGEQVDYTPITMEVFSKFARVLF